MGNAASTAIRSDCNLKKILLMSNKNLLVRKNKDGCKAFKVSPAVYEPQTPLKSGICN